MPGCGYALILLGGPLIVLLVLVTSGFWWAFVPFALWVLASKALLSQYW